MKNLFTAIICTLLFQLGWAQDIKLNNVNSSNILDFYAQTQRIDMQPGEVKSMDVAVQIGQGNNYEMIDRTPQYLEVIQNGNYNTTYFVNPNDFPTNAQIKINGSGNYIDITGSNSISAGMQININANDMTIFMRNY